MSLKFRLQNLSRPRVLTEERKARQARMFKTVLIVGNALLALTVIVGCIWIRTLHVDGSPDALAVELVDTAGFTFLAGQAGLMLLVLALKMRPALKVLSTALATVLIFGGLFALMKFNDRLTVKVARAEILMNAYGSAVMIRDLGGDRPSDIEAKATQAALAPVVEALVRNGGDPSAASAQAKQLVADKVDLKRH